LVLFIIFFVYENIFSQGNSCDNALNNAIKLFNARDYQSAKKAFEIGQKNCENKKVFQEWIKKCDDKMGTPNLPDKQDTPGKQTPAKPVTDKPLNEGKPAYDKDYYSATLQVPKSPIVFSSSKESKELDIITNYSLWKWDKGSAAPSWISIKKNQNSLSIYCEENYSLKDRKYLFTVVAGSKSERIEIIQKGKKDLFPVVRNLLITNLTSNSATYSKVQYKGEKNSAGQRSGLGAQLWANGDFSFGFFSNGVCTHGIYMDGNIPQLDRPLANKFQVGNFKNSQLNGEGRTYSDEGVLTFMGDFSNDEPAGDKSYWRDNLYPELRFEIIQDQLGYYFGETKNGKPHGKGIYILNNNDLWFGDWSNGEKYAGMEIRLDGTLKKE